MRLREHSAIQPGALDIFRADPRHLIEQEGYNVRDLTTPEAQEKLRELAESIAEIGVTDPLVVRFDGERIIVVEGHRRLMATLMAIEAGAEIKSVPIYQEARGVNDAQRDLGLIVSNSGEPLTALEKAKVIGRLVAHGWSHQDIAKKCGWKSVASVLQYLDMLAMPEAVKEQVRAGDVSATVARQIVKESAKDAKDDPDFASELIRKNKEENARIRGKDKKHKVTAKTLKRGKADKLPVPERAKRQHEIGEDTAHEQKPQAGQVAASADLTSPAMVAAASEPLPPVSQERDDDTPFSDERHQDIVRVAAENIATFVAANPDHVTERHASAQQDWDERMGRGTPATAHQSRGVKDLLAALKPFADLCDDIDANEKADDDIVEVLFADIKKAWSVYTAATGGQEEAAA